MTAPRTDPAPAAVMSEARVAPALQQGSAMSTARRTAFIAFAAVYITWGSTYLGIAYAIRTIPVFLMGAMRFAIAGLVFVGIAVARGDPRPTRRELRSAAIAGVLLLAISNASVIWAETRVPSGTTSLLVTTPLWLVLMEWARGRRPTRGVIAGLALGAIGIVILIGPGELAGTGQVDPVGACVLLLSSIVWATGSLYTRYAPLPKSPLMATGWEMVSGSAVLFVVAGVTGEFGHFTVAHVSTVSWLGFGYLIVFGSWVGFTSYIWLMRNVPIEHAATYAFVNPVIAVLLGWAVAGEPFFARTAVAAVFIVAAVASITLLGADTARSKVARE